MLCIRAHATVEEASTALLDFVLVPGNWVACARPDEDGANRPGQRAEYQRQVGNLRICACVEVSPDLDVFLRVAFRAPGLTPAKAADHLEDFLKSRLPLKPNTEWQVEVDERRWIHFVRRYSPPSLTA